MGNTKMIAMCLEVYRRNNLVCDMESFKEEFQRFSYVLKLLSLYQNQGTLNSRLLLNHIVILHNEFGNFCVSVLFQKCPERIRPQLQSLLEFMGLLAPIYKINLMDGNQLDVSTSAIGRDSNLVQLIEEELCRVD